MQGRCFVLHLQRAIDFKARWIENYMRSLRERADAGAVFVSRQCACLSVHWAFFKLATALPLVASLIASPPAASTILPPFDL